jgi:WD40 repeat protein
MAPQVRVVAALLGLLVGGPGLLAQGLKEGTTLKGPRAAYVAFSPDGKMLAAASTGSDSRSPGGDLCLWDVATGRERLTFRCHERGIEGMAFGPEGRTLATASPDQTVKVWDLVEAGGRLVLKERVTIKKSFWNCRCVAFSPDGKRVAAAGDREVQVWDVATKDGLASHSWAVPGWRPALSPDLRTLAVPNHQDVDLWDLAAGKERPPLLDHRGEVTRIVFTPDGRTLVVGSRCTEEGNRYFGQVRLWDWAAGKERLAFQERPAYLFDLALSPDGKLLAVLEAKPIGRGSELHLLALPSGRVLATVSFKGGEEWPISLAFGVNGKVLAAGCTNGTVRLWDVIPPQPSKGPEGRGGASGK